MGRLFDLSDFTHWPNIHGAVNAISGTRMERTHPAPDEQIATIEFFYLHQLVGPDHTKGPIQTNLLWTQTWQ